MKIEWWCEPGHREGVVILNGSADGKTACVATTQESMRLAGTVVLAAIRSSIQTEMEFLLGPFATCPEGEVTQLTWDIFYPQGLFVMDEAPVKPRYLVIHDEARDKQLKYTPPRHVGPRGRWGK